jgi:MoaA/NifB/PqqE/SkfB family radical SAM enzyme
MAPWQPLTEALKKGRYGMAFARRTLVHTNLQILYDCNFRCKICDFWHQREFRDQRPRLSAAQASIISDKLAQIGPQIVSIGGGEPLLHPELMDIVSALSRHHIPVMICNGWYIDRNNARELFERGMYEVSVSVDYADAARHDRQRGVEGAYQRALAALECLVANRVHPEQRVHMISVVMDDNIDDIEKLIRLSADMGVTYLLTLYSDKRGALATRASAPETTRRLLELKARYAEFVVLRGYIGRFSEAIANDGIGPCYAGKNLCNVDSQGQVSLCIDRVDEPVANLLTDDVETVERALLSAHRRNQCKSCWTSCRGTIETLMYGGDRLMNLLDYYQLAKPQPLVTN